MKKLTTLLILGTALGLAAVTPVQADDWSNYRITITNATSHQVLTPPVIVVHNRGFQLFNVGDVASEALITQAETGNPQPLSLDAQNSNGVYNVTTGANVIPYGQSASFEISAPNKANLSITSMLATTNDGFAAINAEELPKASGTYYAYAYDAGSEMNNEACTHVPGPPCAGDSGNARTESGEGFITIHNGVHGGSDLNAKHLDWRGPVAVIKVERINH